MKEDIFTRVFFLTNLTFFLNKIQNQLNENTY